MTDDQGFGDLGLNENPNIMTPNIDKFASESIQFNNFLFRLYVLLLDPV